LLVGADAARDRMLAAAAVSADLTTPVPYVRIAPEAKHNVSDADLQRLGLVPVMHRHDHVIAAYATDGQLRELKKKVGEYQRQTAKHDMLARIATLGPWTRRDRESPRLAALTLEPATSYVVDLMFLPFDDRRVDTGARAAVARFVQAQGGKVLDQMRSARFEALRVRLGGQSLDQLLEHRDDVALVDLPPAAHVSVPAVLRFSLDDVPEAKPVDGSAPQICIIDSGIIEGHPLLEGAIVSARSKATHLDWAHQFRPRGRPLRATERASRASRSTATSPAASRPRRSSPPRCLSTRGSSTTRQTSIPIACRTCAIAGPREVYEHIAPDVWDLWQTRGQPR
jgi:hypothetical protein